MEAINIKPGVRDARSRPKANAHAKKKQTAGEAKGRDDDHTATHPLAVENASRPTLPLPLRGDAKPRSVQTEKAASSHVSHVERP